MSFESNINYCVGKSKNSKENVAGWLKHDHFTTQQHTFEVILKYIPRHLIIWMPFYADGKCGKILTEMGYKVIHEPRDFFEWEPEEWDIVIDNPPYSCKKLVMDRLNSFNKPFALLFPMNTLRTKLMESSILGNFSLMLLNYRKHHFVKLINNVEQDLQSKGPNILMPCWFCFDLKQYLPNPFYFED